MIDNILRISGVVAATICLAACGGGGDSQTADPAPNPTAVSPGASQPVASTPVTAVTQMEAEGVARQGVAATAFGGSHVGVGLALLGGAASAFSQVTAGTQSATSVPCTTGNFTYAFVKSAIQKGFAVGDQIILNYNNCRSGTLTVNGNATITLQTAAVALPAGDYEIRYAAKFDGITLHLGTDSWTYTGSADITSTFARSTSSTQQMSVPVGQTVSVRAQSGRGIEYSGNSLIYVQQTSSPNSAKYGLSGNVELTRDGKKYSLIVSTPTLLAGTTSTGAFVATSGFLASKDKVSGLTTSTAFNGTNASIKVISGSASGPDQSFASTWVTLAP